MTIENFTNINEITYSEIINYEYDDFDDEINNDENIDDKRFLFFSIVSLFLLFIIYLVI